MRIIAGTHRGRPLTVPAGGRVRPTADRVREAWCSILHDRLAGARVVDLFAGSGALGLEALSRGAEHADFVERARPSLVALAANIERFGVQDRSTVHRVEGIRFARRLPAASYDVAFADPPYATDLGTVLVEVFRVNPFATVLGVEHRAAEPVAGDETRTYGDIAITFCYAP